MNRKRTYIFFGISLWLFPLLTMAQSNAVEVQNRNFNANNEKLSLRRAVDLAWQNNYTIKQSILQVRNNEVLLEQAKYNRYPTLTALAQEGLNFGRSINPYTNTFVEKNINFNNMQLSAGGVVFQGNQLKNAIIQGQQNLQASEQDAQATRDQIALNVVLAYLQILNNEDLLTVAQAQSAQSKVQLARIEKLVKAGSLPQTNLLDIEAQLANDESAIINAQNNLDAAKLQLLQLVNDRNVQDISIDRGSVPIPSAQVYEASATDIYALAESAQPMVKAADMRVKGAITGIEIAKGGLLPTISIGANWSGTYTSANKQAVLVGTQDVNLGNVQFNGQTFPLVIQQPQYGEGNVIGYFDQLKNTQSKAITMNIRIPIFNGYTAKNRIQQAHIQKLNLEYEAQKVRQTLRQNIETAYNNMTAAAKRFAATQRQVEALELAFKAADTRYSVGASNFVDYNLAKTNLEKAKATLIQTKYDYVFRTKILDYYQNKPL
jgi:outer membrane protein